MKKWWKQTRVEKKVEQHFKTNNLEEKLKNIMIIFYLRLKDLMLQFIKAYISYVSLLKEKIIMAIPGISDFQKILAVKYTN